MNIGYGYGYIEAAIVGDYTVALYRVVGSGNASYVVSRCMSNATSKGEECARV